jgi:hypothetical protein
VPLFLSEVVEFASALFSQLESPQAWTLPGSNLDTRLSRDVDKAVRFLFPRIFGVDTLADVA